VNVKAEGHGIEKYIWKEEAKMKVREQLKVD
jgi:hypothetical protein